MATSWKIHLEASQQPEFYVKGITAESAETASKLLQENHEKHHIFFNQSGFHNHIAHQLLTLFALNASPAELQKAYDDNVSYQRPLVALQHSIVEDMHLEHRFKTYLGKEQHYHDFLIFFQKEMDKLGWETVLNEYMFKGDERADDMLVRMFAGFMHPLIHLGFGVEFAQPALIAEALAQAAVHDSSLGTYFFSCEAAAAARTLGPDEQQEATSKTLVELLGSIRADEKLRRAAHWTDASKLRDGVLKRAPAEIISIASQYQVLPDRHRVEEKTAEMMNAAVYYTATSQHPPHIPKFDFFYLHAVTSSLFFPRFQKMAYLHPSAYVRLLTWKSRLDLALYASRGAPCLDIAHVAQYASSNKGDGWDAVFERVRKYSEDGHAGKLVRALARAETVCEGFEDESRFRIKRGMWRTMGGMVMDSVEAGGPTWVRGAGFEEAWSEVPLREGEVD